MSGNCLVMTVKSPTNFFYWDTAQHHNTNNIILDEFLEWYSILHSIKSAYHKVFSLKLANHVRNGHFAIFSLQNFR